MSSDTPLHIRYHRDFDGMVSAAVLSHALRSVRGEHDQRIESVNYDQRADWDNFCAGQRFALVDFHFHPRAEYWFDHHPTTFLSPELRAAFEPSQRWAWDATSPSCPPLILAHAATHWGYQIPERFHEMAHWSNVIDAALFESVEQALFGEQPALRIMRSLHVAPHFGWIDELAAAMVDADLDQIAARADVERAYERSARNRDKALRQFPPCVLSTERDVLLYDASSNKIRRERFAAFYHHPEMRYSVGVIPTRGGFHVSAGENPWNKPTDGLHVGELMETFGGGGHRAVGGANARDLDHARELSAEVAELLRTR